jgi:bis(5'-nucleosidyl)-tetraphosphatase
MIHEKSCGAIVFHQSDGKVSYLLLKHRNGLHWGFPKGHVEAGESEAETALREIYEEAGLRVKLRAGFRTTVEYAPSQGAWKEVVYFLGEASNLEVSYQEEEVGDYCWAEYETALKLLTHENNRGLLREADQFLMSNPRRE